ncbi:hypothetical protein P0L94_02745 [Microbacter sp. GSS18]|nr:hypothetical protein P0L94_02745 [Microbacter sp. GSS18]
MSGNGDIPDGEDLEALREEIDELKKIPEEELISPLPTEALRDEPTPEPTDAIGSEDWGAPDGD